jgi:hypothetical protein
MLEKRDMKKVWAERKKIALAFGRIGLVPECYLRVWNSEDEERRLYISDNIGRQIVTYWYSGNNRHPPETIRYSQFAKTFFKDGQIDDVAIKELCFTICNKWQNISFCLQTAMSFELEVIDDIQTHERLSRN